MKNIIANRSNKNVIQKCWGFCFVLFLIAFGNSLTRISERVSSQEMQHARLRQQKQGWVWGFCLLVFNVSTIVCVWGWYWRDFQKSEAWDEGTLLIWWRQILLRKSLSLTGFLQPSPSWRCAPQGERRFGNCLFVTRKQFSNLQQGFACGACKVECVGVSRREKWTGWIITQCTREG